MEIKHTTYGPTYTPREPPAASREATTPTHKFFLTSLPFTGSIIDTISILVATNLAVRQASGVRTSHENRRSLEARQRRHQLRNDKRRQSRRDYRSWIRSVLEGGKFTLAHPRRPMKRVNNSPAQLRRAYFNQRFHPTIGSRASLFHRYVQPSLLDLPVRHLSQRPSSNQLHMATWNIETLIGLGKHQALAEFVIKQGLDILCIQETKWRVP